MDKIVLPEITEAGIYDASVKHKNCRETKNRNTYLFEIELPITKGGIPITKGGRAYVDKNSYDIMPSHILCIKPGQVRHTRLPFYCYYVHLSLSEGILYDYLMETEVCYEVEDIQKYTELFQKIIYTYTNKFDGYEIYLQSCIMELIYIIHRDGCNNERVKKCANPLITNAINYIEEHSNENITLEILAEQLHISPVYFHKIFTQAMNRTPYRYILDKKIDLAKKLLLISGKSCLDIALETGFSSQSYFNYTFKKETGLTPNQYKKQQYSKYPD